MSEQGPTVFGGRYELHRRLARGGMADVYLARDQLLDRPVAVKVLFAEFATDPTFVERFRREAQAAANLNHPNIVSIYDWGEEAGTYYIVMEYIEGKSLAQIIAQEGRLHPDRAADIAGEVASALGFAHSKSLAHRDVKPGNVLMSSKGEIKVADFGIATAMVGGAENNLTQTGAVMGTATYFSPEQAQGKPVDPRSDLYSLGVVLYEMLVGSPPFTGDTPVSIAYKHVQEAPIPPGDRGVDIPQPLAAITMKLLAKNPANRYPTSDDLRSDLRRYRSGAYAQEAAQAAPVPAPATTAMPVGAAPGAGAMATTAMPADMVAATQAMPPASYVEPERNNRSGWIAAGFVVLLLGLIGLIVAMLAYFSDSGVPDLATDDPTDETAVDLVTVQSVFMQPEVEAIRVLETQGLVVRSQSEVNEETDAGLVFSQDPRAGTEVERGAEITLLVSAGEAPIEIPDVVTLQQTFGEGILRDAGFEVQVRAVEDDEVFEGEILSQDPPALELRPRGSTVTLQVSQGPGEREVPDIAELPYDEAKTALEDAGFRVTRVNEESSTVEAESVIRTDPEASTLMAPDSVVEVFVSVGASRLILQDVVLLTRDQAVADLQNSGFIVQEQFIEQTDLNFVGIVIEQSPVAFTEVEESSVILLTVGSAPQATPTPIAPTVTPIPVATATPIPAQPTATEIPATPIPTSPPVVVTATPTVPPADPTPEPTTDPKAPQG